MAYSYDDRDREFRQSPPPRPPRKEDNDLGSWILIIFLFIVAWPAGLAVLLSKVLGNDSQRKNAARSTRSTVSRSDPAVSRANPNPSQARPGTASAAGRKVTKTPQYSAKAARNMKIVGLVLLFAGRLAGAFERAMPHGIAEMMAMTVAAQLFTLPIQVLMEPELPLLSVPANLLVSPFVGLATMAGLMALACAWCEPWLAGVFAWISSWGTLVMERVALWLGGSTMAVIPWKDGVTGAVLIVAVEIGIGMLLVFVSRCLQHVRRYEAGMPGVRFGSAWRVRLSLWCEETRRLFTRRQAE